jgi:GTP cyclohydrolase II
MGLLSAAATSDLHTAFGAFTVDVFTISGSETVVLRTKDIPGKVRDVLCRIQSECISHVFGDQRWCDCADQVGGALRRIHDEGTGLLIYLRQEGMGLGLAGKLVRDSRDWRSYDIAAEILANWGIRSIRLISLNKHKIESLKAHGIDVEMDPWGEGRTILLGHHMSRTVDQVRRGEKVRPIGPAPRSRVLVLGDLNIDQFPDGDTAVGGTAFHVARALEASGKFTPIIFGKVGQDDNGDRLRGELLEQKIYSLIGIHPEKATGLVRIIETSDLSASFQFQWDKRNNANDYDAETLAQAIELVGLGPGDYAYVSAYLFVQKLFQVDEVAKILSILSATQCSLIFDVARKAFAWDVLTDCEAISFSEDDLKQAIGETEFHTVIGEIGTFDSFNLVSGHGRPSQDDRNRILSFFRAKYLMCRYVTGRGRRHFVANNNGVVLEDSNLIISELRVGTSDQAMAWALGEIEQYERMQR